MIDITKSLAKSISTIENVLTQLKQCKVTLVASIAVGNNIFDDEKLRKDLTDSFKTYKRRYIYVIKINDWAAHQLISTAYREFNIGNKPRTPNVTLHTSRFNITSSEYLYVGSSKDLRSRMCQHLGDGPKRTYALHLRHWFPRATDLTIFIYEVESEDQNLIEAVEQGMWDEAKPMFGKRSGH